MRATNLLLIAPLCLLIGCGWVDSTGREGNSAPVTQISFDDGQEGVGKQINELTPTSFKATGSDVDGRITSYRWSERPVRQGPLNECLGAADFNMADAANSLSEACAEDSECSVSIVQQDDSVGNDVEFVITAPDIRAPVGLTYELTTLDNDGGSARQLSTFCLIAINMAPEAIDDAYTVLEGETLVVNTPARSLINNDKDDIHVSNKPLSVLVEPKRAPSMASAFVLRSDGGFTYTPAVQSSTSDSVDSFEYWLTDGFHDPVFGTATVRIVAIDDPPEQVDEIPALEVVAGVPFEFDLAPFFEDPEGSNLSFALVGGALPQSGTLLLSSAGVISGTTELFDEGNYAISIAASDGSSGITAEINLAVVENLEVVATSIPAQVADAGVVFLLDVSDNFDDPENQDLIYTVDTEYDSAELSMNARTGVLTAVFNDDRRYVIDVSADDGVTVPTSIRFVVTVTLDNASPVFRGSISNQTVDVGELIDPISGLFSDPDGDTLEYKVLGTLPAGLSLSSRGVLSGRPSRDGLYSGIRLVATDPFGEFARSNAFSIRVLPVLRNTAPEYIEDTVFNQGILLGESIRSIEPEFIDADGDTLGYSVIGGTLPRGVRIDATTGVISGKPLEEGWVRDLQVLATDPSGASATSDEFWIRVR